MYVNSSSDEESEEHFLVMSQNPKQKLRGQPSTVQSCMCFLQFQSEHDLQLQSHDDSEIADQAETLYEVIMDSFHGAEQNGMDQSSVDNAMFVYERLQSLDSTFVVDFSALIIENFNTGVLTEPDVEEMLPPDMDDEYATIVLPDALEELSPDHMAMWMISRLSKRTKECIEEGEKHWKMG